MKKITTMILALTVVMTLTQCKKKNDDGENTDGTKVKVTCTVPMNNGGKSEFDNPITDGTIQWSEAGCGMSRAALALLRLDFAAAWRYHPLVFVMPYVMIYLLFDLKPKTVHHKILLVIGVSALIHWAFVLFQH